MLHPRLARFALLGIAFLLVVPSIPAANTPIEGTLTKSYPEDYESFATVPTAPTTPWATFNTAGAGTAQVTATTLTGSTRALSVTDDAIAGFVHQQVNTGSGVNLCLQDQTLAFTFTLTSSMTAGQSVELRASTAAATAGTQPADSFGLILTGQVGAGELASVYMRGDTGGAVTPTSIGTFTLPAVGTVLMDTIICAGSTPQVRFVINGGGLSFTGTYTAAVAFVGTVNRFSVAHISSAAPFGGTVDVDDFLWDGAPLPAPTISSVNPTQGNAAGGESFTVTGTGFKTGAQVKFGTSDATGESVTATTITGLTPAHAAGLLNVQVVNPDGQTATLVNSYTYNPAPTPVITSIVPGSGLTAGGQVVDVSGQNFRTGFTATFGGVAAVSTAFIDGTHVRATSPPHAAGTVALRITNDDGQFAEGQFVYNSGSSNPSPFITSIVPNTGPIQGGQTVSINGGNFVNGATVLIDTSSAPATFVSSAQLSIVTPSHAFGSVDIKVTNPDGQNFVFSNGYGYGQAPTGLQVYLEDFEDDSNGAHLPAEDWYQGATSANGLTQVTNGDSVSAPNSWHTVGLSYWQNDFGSCDGTLEFDAKAISGNGFIGLVSGGGAGMIGFYHNGAGIQAYMSQPEPGGGTRDAQIAMLNPAPSAWRHYTLVIDCDNPRQSSAFVTGYTGESNAWVSGSQFGFPAGLGGLDFFGACAGPSAQCNTLTANMDNVRFQFGSASGSESSTCIFCSAPGNENFGYDFVEGVEFRETRGSCGNNDFSTSNVGISPCYRFSGDETNFDYLAKSWTPATQHVESYFTIEAASEGESSRFRSNFGSVAGVPDNAAKGSGSCQGKCNGQFAEHVEVQFDEFENDWNVKILHVSQSHAVTTRTQLGTTFVGDSPNTPTAYKFSVDSSITPAKAYVQRLTLEAVDCGKAGAIVQADGTCTTGNFIQTDLFAGGVNLPSYWSGVGFLNHWFVGYATDTFTSTNAQTRLDPGGNPSEGVNEFSTCIYSVGVVTPVANGDQGRVPPPDSDGDGTPDALDQDDDNDGTPDVTDVTPGTTTTDVIVDDGGTDVGGSFFLPADAVLPDGFTRDSFSFLLGVLFMFGVAGGAYVVLGRSPMAAGIGGAGGFMGAFAFGLFPLWAVLLVALGCAAVFVLRFKASGG